MFNRLHKLIAYTLIISMLIGACSIPVMAAAATDEQSVSAEVLQEESRDPSASGGGSDDNDSGMESDEGDPDGGSDDSDLGVESDDSDSGGESDGDADAGRQDDQTADSDGGSADDGKAVDPDDEENTEGTADEEPHLNPDEEREETSGDSSGYGDTGGDSDEGSTGAGGRYDGNGSRHSDDPTDPSGAGYTGDYDYAGENEPGQDGGSQGKDQDGIVSGQGQDRNGTDQGRSGSGSRPQDSSTDPADSANPPEHPNEKRSQIVTGRPSYAKHMGDKFFRLDVETDGDGTLVFWSSNERVIDMSHTGRAYIKGTGTAVIGIMAQETDSCKKSNILRVVITVRKREQKIDAPGYYTKSVETDPFEIDLTKVGNGPVIYESSNKNVATVSRSGKVSIKSVGSAKITVYAEETATCMRSAAKTIHVNVGPRKTELSGGISVEDNKATVEWQKQNDVSGYLVQYSTRRDFSGGKIVRAASSAKSAQISGLTDDAYYVRVRAFKTQDDKKLYSEWSHVEVFGGRTATPAAGTGEDSGPAESGVETRESAGSAPIFSTVLTNPFWAVGKALSMRVTNTGSAVMRVYSKDARLSNEAGGLFDSDLYIAAEDDSELPYVDIQPGETADLRFCSADHKKLRYSRRTKVRYAFCYGGVDYVAMSGEDNRTEYAEGSADADSR